MNSTSSLSGHRRSIRPASAISFWLAYQPPLHWPSLLGFLAARAISGVETVVAGVYTRSFDLARGQGIVQVAKARGHRLKVTVIASSAGALPGLLARVRRVFDLDAEPLKIEALLRRDPLMAQLIELRPGLRVPRGWDGFEQAMRTVLGQQISVAGAITLAGRLVAGYGEPLAAQLQRVPGLTHVFPRAEAVADVDLSGLGMPRLRAATLSTLARALLHDPQLLRPERDLEAWVQRLCRLRGIGPWSAHYLALRQMGAADALPLGDVALVKALRLLEGPEAQLAQRAPAWSPWRAYAAQHLWASLS
ncbi:DNA-3-methyladenine glycosylase 2 family protein [Pseudomonas sp. BIGb0427]|uniref:DNA-3-methyladenine glycosylase family protein n=1 Tax=unclassified Pseudomonas TaxID=196821 RepID=UPI0018A7CA03|nr:MULTISPECIES: AlkA N-terminal domain-containing protein [unclassified Pseudomonas]QPG61575.1 DNA-3-methyladenine glycosylase 2 family protein [Pseudomonas sp. BIGb0427]UVM69087.1 DNA-3-methyladenine glycosylase 2 family protein [Pseudomonas sp. B21-009]